MSVNIHFPLLADIFPSITDYWKNTRNYKPHPHPNAHPSPPNLEIIYIK